MECCWTCYFNVICSFAVSISEVFPGYLSWETAQLCSAQHFAAYWVILANTVSGCAALSEERQTILACIWKTFWLIQKKKHFHLVCCCLPRIGVKNWKRKKKQFPPLQPSLWHFKVFLCLNADRSSGNLVCIPQPGPTLWKLESGKTTPLWEGSRELMFLPQAAIPPFSATTWTTLHSVPPLH